MNHLREKIKRMIKSRKGFASTDEEPVKLKSDSEDQIKPEKLVQEEPIAAVDVEPQEGSR